MRLILQTRSTFIIILTLLDLLLPFGLSSPPPESWCFVKNGCNQDSPTSAWNQGTCKTGKRQSPIDIPEDAISGGSIKDTIDFSEARLNYDLTSFILKNDGKHVDLTAFKTVTGKKPGFSWPKKNDSIYTLQEIHVHWGPSNKNSSEHSLAGVKYAMEMHLIHYKSSSASDGFRDVAAAKKSGSPDAMATIAILFHADSNGSESTTALQPFIKNIGKVVHRGDKTTVDEEGTLLMLSDILKVQEKAVNYHGSTTTPACDEGVTWLVGLHPVSIKVEDVQTLRETVHGVDGRILKTNRRRQQPLNGRVLRVVEFKQ